MYSIAQKYGVSESLLALNNGVTDSLVVGEDLVVLFPLQTHTVDFGDTVESIAEKYGTTKRKVFQNNYYLKGRDKLYTGQTIVISYSDIPDRGILTNGYAYP